MSKPLPMTGGARDSSKLLNNANEFPFSKAQILQRIKAKERAQHDYQIDQKTMESKIYSLQNKKSKKVRGGGKYQQEYVETNRLETEANEPLAQQAQKSDEEMSQYSSDSREIQRQISRHKSVFFGKKALADFSVDMSQWRDVPHPNGMTYALRRFQRVARKVINSMDAHQRIDTSLGHKSMIKFIGNDVSTQKGSEKAKLVVAESQGCNFFTVWDVLVLFATSVFLYVVVFE